MNPVPAKFFLSRLSSFMRKELLADDVFRDDLGIVLDHWIFLGDQRIRFAQKKLFAAIRSYHDKDRASVDVEDTDGRTWALTSLAGGGRPALELRAGDDRLIFQDVTAFLPKPDARLAAFDQDLRLAGLAPSELASWRGLLATRSLNDDEVRRLEADLENTPTVFMAALEDRRHDGMTTSAIVPANRRYFELLIGQPAPVALSSPLSIYARDVAPRVVGDQLAWDVRLGARRALALGWQATVLGQTLVSSLDDGQFRDLCAWARDEGDLVSKVASIEQGLLALGGDPVLEPVLVELVEQILALDPHQPDGKLALLSGLITFVGGELSWTRVLNGWAPFYRRLATFAQASLVERQAPWLDVETFAAWSAENRGLRFWLQGLVDLRQEPRWLPEYAGPTQLKHEFLGRITGAAAQISGTLPQGRLRELLFGDQGVRAQASFPASFLPGPLEGAASDTAPEFPAEFSQAVDEVLAQEKLEVRTVNAVVNLQGALPVPAQNVERVLHLIREASHRLPLEPDDPAGSNLLIGLARLAAITRHLDLAEEVRIIARRRRLEATAAPVLMVELELAITAAAAHSELGPWSQFFGAWATELAFACIDREDATSLLTVIEHILNIEPMARVHASGAVAALRSFVRS
jgi:hypothetical protein